MASLAQLEPVCSADPGEEQYFARLRNAPECRRHFDWPRARELKSWSFSVPAWAPENHYFAQVLRYALEQRLLQELPPARALKKQACSLGRALKDLAPGPSPARHWHRA